MESKLKLLVVDDSMVMRKIINSAFISYPIEFLGEAENGEIAMTKFKELKPDIVTMDLTMPIFDGFECIKEMRNLDSNVKIMVISALSDKEDALKALKLGANDFALKPINQKKIVRFLEKIIDERKI